MSGGILKKAIAAAVAIVFLSACGTTVAGKAGPDPSAAELRLDTGNYATKPRQVPKPPPAETKVQGSWAVADALVSPAEVDPALQYLDNHDTGVVAVGSGIIDSTTTRLLLGQKLGEAIPTDTLAGGYSVARRTEEKVFTGTGRGLLVAVARFISEDTAKTAVDRLKQARATGLSSSLDGLPGHPGAVAIDPRFAEVRSAPAIWVVQNKGDVIIVGPYGSSLSVTDAKVLAAKTVDAQLPRLESMRVSAAEMLDQPVDVQGIMSLTLERARPASDVVQVQRRGGYMTPRAFITSSSHQWSADVKLLIDDAGVDLIGASQSYVFRAKSPVAAEVGGRGMGTRGVATDPVPGVPSSLCYKSVDTSATSTTSDTFSYRCTVWRGKYFAWVIGYGTPQSAWQQAAAQYIILGQAE